MKKLMTRVVSFILILLLCIQNACPVFAEDVAVPPIKYVSLGDSIAKGYSNDGSELTNYPDLVKAALEEKVGRTVEVTNYARNGLDTKVLNGRILSDPDIEQSLKEADLITLTMGSNDLLNSFKQVCRDLLNTDAKFKSADDALEALEAGMKSNPLIIVKVIAALTSWDYETFENEWVTAMDTIALNRKENAQLVVTNIYNPVSNFELPSTMNAVVEGIIQNMDDIIAQYAEHYEYQMVDLFNSEISLHVQSDGIHPDQAGHILIAGEVTWAIKLAAFSLEPVQAAALKMSDEENQEKREAETRKTVTRKKGIDIRRIVIGAGIGAAALVCGTIYLAVRFRRKRKKG